METLFAYQVDPPDTLYSPYLKINYNKQKLEIKIDTLSGERKSFLEDRLNKLIFEKDTNAISYFRSNQNKLNRLIVCGLSANLQAVYVLNLCYAYEPDSIEQVAKHFLVYDKFSNPPRYEVEEPALDEVYHYRKDWVIKYFPLILDKYSLNYYQKVLLSCYLFKVGQEKYLRELASLNNLSAEEKTNLNQNLKNFHIKL